MGPILAVVALALSAGPAAAAVTPALDVSLSDKHLGVHADVTVRLDFDYGDGGLIDSTLYPPPSDWRESVKTVVVDIPNGLVGNPNAVPYAERCDMAQFETGICPDSATIGTFGIKTTLWSDDLVGPPLPGDGGLQIDISGPNGIAGSKTKMSLLKTDSDVPATIGIYVLPPLGAGAPIRTKMVIAPDVRSNLKLRTTTPEGITRELWDRTVTTTKVANLRIDQMRLKFRGTLVNGNAFMTNPTECGEWKSTLYAQAYFFNENSDSDPLGGGTNAFKKAESTPITADCSNVGGIPFPISGKTTISTAARDISPDFDFTIEEPGIFNSGQVPSTPKKIVTTVPASINVDVQQLGRVCQLAQFEVGACPESTKVGVTSIETPLVVAGFGGSVYLVKNPKNTLPDLGLQINQNNGPATGAINFRQLGENHYVNTNQIQTTFDNIPAVGFSKLNVHLFGGPNGLLRSLACPKGNKSPRDGSFTYDFTAYSGATNASTTKLTGTPCFGIQKLRSFRCVYRVLRFQPTYTSRKRVKRVVLYVDGKRISTARQNPFQFRVKATRFKRGKHKFTLKATYDDGTVSVKKSRFRRC